MDPEKRLFDLLDKWRHFPNYQLERRADVLMALFLPGALSEFTGVELAEELIPEFPIKRDLIWPETPTSKSVKVDYLALAADRSKGFLIELKTDVGSRRDAQDHYLHRASELGLGALLDGYLAIIQATSAHQKYFHLTRQLSDLGLLRLPDALENHLYPTPRPGLRAQLARIERLPCANSLQIVYVQPTGGDDQQVMDFEFLATYIARFDAPFARRFAASLRTWQQAAGSARPPG